MKRTIPALAIALVVGYLLAGCGGGADAEPPPDEGRPAAPSDVVPPQFEREFAPSLSAGTEDLLARYEGTVRAVVRVAVRSDGTPADARVMAAEPADAPAARAFAEDVAKSIRGERFRPATRGGRPVDTALDFTFEATGGEAPAAEPR